MSVLNYLFFALLVSGAVMGAVLPFTRYVYKMYDTNSGIRYFPLVEIFSGLIFPICSYLAFGLKLGWLPLSIVAIILSIAEMVSLFAGATIKRALGLRTPIGSINRTLLVKRITMLMYGAYLGWLAYLFFNLI